MKQTLKLLLTGLILAGSPALLKAQVPQKFNYQGIARDTKGNPMGKQTLGIKLSVLPTSDATTPEYEEVQTITTNEFGLYTLQIGNGTAVTGTMKEVKWETGNKYIKVAIDPQGGTNYADAGTTQLLSVPYAIYADKAGMAKETTGGDRAGAVSTSAAGTGTVNFLTKFTAANTIYDSQVFDNGTNIGIGTTTPAATAKIHINQNSASVLEHIRMQNLSSTGAGRFTMYSNGANNYSTFTKYGSGYAGGYAGVTTLYPYANLLAFGNNGVAANDGLGRFLISTAGNAGISIFKGGTSKLKFHADFTTENVGIGGNSAPVSRVHMNNTDGANMDLRLTNNISAHTASDGLLISQIGDTASISNLEAGPLTFGVDSIERMRISEFGYVGIGTNIPVYPLDVVHGGSTGVRIRSTGSFSVLDIDAASGDAALRFANNGVNQWNIRNQPGTDNLQIFELGGGGERFMIENSTGNVGIGTNGAPTQKLDIDGQIRIRGGSPAAGSVLTSDANGVGTWATPAPGTITSSVGTNDYLPKFATGGTSLVNSVFRDNGTSAVCGSSTPTLGSQLFVYREQLVANGNGQYSLYAYRTRDAQNNGTGYSQNSHNSAMNGYNFWGDVYTFGVSGHSWNDYSRTGGVLGSEVNGAYWGSLGYRSSALLNYGVYGTSAYASGGGFLPSNEVAGIGGGFFGSMVGSISKGKVIGQMNSGELFASYNLGDEYTSGKQIELVDNGNEKVAAYSVTSTELTIYKKGKATLVNGSVFIPFDNNYSSLLADIPVVTVSAMGLCNGLYIASVDKNGFTVKELNGGSSNVNISWISVGDRIDNHPESTIPQEVLSNQFDTNLQQVMYDDSKKDGSGQGMWWDGQTKNIKFGVTPASTSPAPKPEGTQE
jgi:hypothetical protein